MDEGRLTPKRPDDEHALVVVLSHLGDKALTALQAALVRKETAVLWGNYHKSTPSFSFLHLKNNSFSFDGRQRKGDQACT